jgi:cytochrome c
MKKIMIGCFAVLAVAACNSGGSKEKEDKPAKTADITTNPDYQKGLELVTKNKKCLTCHAIDDAVTGPSYRDVANKYASYPDTIIPHLAGKIINGGNGVWGEIFMTPNNEVSQADAEAMVRYILLLKK